MKPQAYWASQYDTWGPKLRTQTPGTAWCWSSYLESSAWQPFLDLSSEQLRGRGNSHVVLSLGRLFTCPITITVDIHVLCSDLDLALGDTANCTVQQQLQ